MVRENFPWPNLAFLDTPGYSGQSQVGGRTDASIAAAQLNSAHVMVWVVNAKQGTLPETDINFLARLDASIPKLVVLSRADQLNDSDRAAVVERIASTLATRKSTFMKSSIAILSGPVVAGAATGGVGAAAGAGGAAGTAGTTASACLSVIGVS